MDIDDVPIKANMTHPEWKSIDSICMISVMLPSLSETMALGRRPGREKCFTRGPHRATAKFGKAEDGPKECEAKRKANTACQARLPSPADPTRVLERELWAALAPGRSRASPWKKPALTGAAGWGADEAPPSSIARGCELGGQKQKVPAVKELGVNVPLSRPLSDRNSTTHLPYAAVHNTFKDLPPHPPPHSIFKMEKKKISVCYIALEWQELQP